MLANIDFNAIINSLRQTMDTNSVWPYVILLVWTFLEGETIVIFAGFCATDGVPNIWLVILSAFCGSLCSDQLMFFLGRCKGKTFIAKRPKWQLRAQKVYRILERHQIWLILGFRFLYGLRNITPFAIGMSEVRTRRFILLNVTGAAVWATVFAFAGYLFGTVVETYFEKEGKWIVMGAVVGVAFVVWVVRHIRRRRMRIANGAQAAEAGVSPPLAGAPTEKQA